MNYTTEEIASLAHHYCNNLLNPPPEIRNVFLYLAETAYNNRNFQGSIYYQTQALCNAFAAKNIFYANNIDMYNGNILSDIILPKNYKQIDHSNPLVDYAKSKFLSKGEIRRCSQDFKDQFNLNREIKKMQKFCQELPKEWSVVQITKGYNTKMTIQSKDENFTTNIPIYLTILKHSRSAEFPNEPLICIKIDISKFDIYKRFFKVGDSLKVTGIAASENNLSNEQKLEYKKKMLSLENEITGSIEDLEKAIGPWICLFAKNVDHNDNQRKVRKIFETVDEFCLKHKLDHKTKILLSLLLLQPSRLTEENCIIASNYFNSGRNIFEHFYNFLTTNKETYSTLEKSETTMPCILIIDEMLDHFPWEFLNKNQEFCRVASFNILKQLYNKHRTKILNGYINIEVKTGNFLVNPENNLENTEKRMRSFGSYWLPEFNFIFGKKPTNEKIKEIFTSDHIYVYCGHGHGMGIMSPHKLGISEICNPVAFLFGCESVKLTMKSDYGDMIGEHLYFHKGLCPAVVGCNFIAFDMTLDIISTDIISSWIPSKQKIHWKNVDKDIWKKSNLIQTKTIKSTKFKYEPRLAAILARIRSENLVKYYHLITLIYRGLPVWNTGAEEKM